MKIEHDKSYLYLYEQMRQTGFTKCCVTKLRFNVQGNDEQAINAMKEILDWMEANFKLYQYVKNNRVKFGDQDLFFWSNGSLNYFTIDYNEKDEINLSNDLTDKIIKHIENNYSNVEGTLSLQYEDLTDWNLVNNYIMETEFDYNNLPFNMLNPIINKSSYKGNTLSLESREKLHKLEGYFLESLVGEKVIYNNNIVGSLKKVGNDEYGVFKPRATRTYFPISLGRIQSCVLK